jgi:hypothetical protein
MFFYVRREKKKYERALAKEESKEQRVPHERQSEIKFGAVFFWWET